MIRKNSKCRLRNHNGSAEKKQVEKLPPCPVQMSMFGVKLMGASKSAKTERPQSTIHNTSPISPIPFLPNAIGRTHLVQSPDTAARCDFLKRAREARENAECSSPDSDADRLPVIKPGGHRLRLQDNHWISPREAFAYESDSRGRENDSSAGSDKVRLPEIRISSSKVRPLKPANSQELQHAMNGEILIGSNPRSAEERHRRLPEINRHEKEKKSLTNKNENISRFPATRANPDIASPSAYPPIAAFGQAVDQQLSDLKRRRQLFLPSLSKNSELVSNGNICESNSASRNGLDAPRETRRGNRPVRSGKLVDNNATKRLSSPKEVAPFEEKMVGTACPKSKRSRKQRQKSGLPSLKTKF